MNWTIGKPVSTIILKSWPKDDKGSYVEEDVMVLEHLLGWRAAKNIFKLCGNFSIYILISLQTVVYVLKLKPYDNGTIIDVLSAGADEKLINQLSKEAKEKLAMATSIFKNTLKQLVTGNIKIKLLNLILQKSAEFLELLRSGKIPHT